MSLAEMHLFTCLDGVGEITIDGCEVHELQ